MEFPLWNKFFIFADIIMRVPPLFIIDGLFRISLGLPDETIVLNSTDNDFKITSVLNTFAEFVPLVGSESFLLEYFNFEQQGYQMFIMIMLKFIVCCIGKNNILL